MYKKRKQFDNRYLLIFIIVIVSVLLVVLAVFLKNDRKLNPLERVIKDAGTYTIKLVKYPFDFVSGKNKRNNKYTKDMVNASNDNIKDEVNRLKKLLELNTVLSGKVLVNATVVYRNLGYFYDEVTIDKGSKDGVEANMAVVNSSGLIGKTSKVSNHSCSVKLLSNENMSNKISVKIKVDKDYVYGLISKYDSKANLYTIEGISQNVDIPEGADVVTTGMGAIFPSGLLIGKVKKITTDNFDLSKVVEVESSVNFDDIDYVTVVKREK